MASYRNIPIKQLQIGMAFTKPLYNKNEEVMLPEYYPIYYEFLMEWTSRKYKSLATAGKLITESSQHRKILPGYISVDIRQMIQHYYDSIQVLKEAFSDLRKINLGTLQKLCSGWISYILKGAEPQVYLQVIRYAVPKEEDYSFVHILDVLLFSLGVYVYFNPNYTSMNLMQVAMGAVFSDIGMFSLPAHLRSHEKVFDDTMKKQIQQHTVLGYRMLVEELKTPVMFALPALEHHERPDGSGYPRGLKGKAIQPHSIIIGLADIFTSQIRDRSFRIAKEPAEILKDFLSTTMPIFKEDTAQYLKAFVSFLTVYPVTSFLELSTGEIVIVKKTKISTPQKPCVMIILDRNGLYNLTNDEIVLENFDNNHISIKSMFGREQLLNMESLHIIPVVSEGISVKDNPNTYKFTKHLIFP